MKVKKIVNKDKKYVSKNGKEYTETNFYLVLDNGSYLAIRPCFAKGYQILDAIAEITVNGK